MISLVGRAFKGICRYVYLMSILSGNRVSSRQVSDRVLPHEHSQSVQDHLLCSSKPLSVLRYMNHALIHSTSPANPSSNTRIKPIPICHPQAGNTPRD
jgi:hypothetical protein